MTVEERFRHYVEKTDGCWLWRGTLNHNGYGILGIGGGKHMLAHRWAHQQFKSPLDGRHVCHTCDTPRCVNPDHLFLGTDADNHADKARKLRAGRVLTPDQVRQIKHTIETAPVPLHLLAERFGCSRKAVQRIKNGHHWKFA